MKTERTAKPKRRLLFLAFAAVCVAGMAFSAYQLIAVHRGYRQSAGVYEALDAYVRPAEEKENEPQAERFAHVDFDALRAINSDVSAWLTCAGTKIHYPVVQTTDNVYYLTHLFDRTENSAGCLFIDSRNHTGFIDRNTIIYGHNMRNQSMFATLTQYKDAAFYQAHPSMQLLTPQGNYRLELFAGYVAGTDAPAWQVSFSDDDAFEQWIRDVRARSTFQSDVSVTAADKVVTLSTCSYEFDDARYVVLGKLTPIAN